MANESSMNHVKSVKPLWLRAFVFVLFLVTVCSLAGYIAISFRYPSLYNVTASFAEYATPLPYYWGILHIPSMIIFGVPLLVLPLLQEKLTQYFRVFCVCAFLLLLLELDSKIPFLLFPKIDALVALILSFVVVPPNSKNNPKLVKVLKLSAIFVVILIGFLSYTFLKHQTPTISNSQYAGGIFELKSINVKNDFHKEMIFEIDLKALIPEQMFCKQAQSMAKAVLQDYPFDNSYNKTIKVNFNPTSLKTSVDKSYALAEISLNDAHKDKNGDFACYVKFK